MNYRDYDNHLLKIKPRMASSDNLQYLLEILGIVDFISDYYQEKGYEIPTDIYEAGFRGLQKGTEVYVEKDYYQKQIYHEYISFWMCIAMENKIGVKAEDRLTEDAEDEYQAFKKVDEEALKTKDV